jgi:hypothetical protein
MSLLVLLDSAGTAGGTSSAEPPDSGLLQAILDAIHGSDDQVAGMRMTRLLEVLEEVETTDMLVESTLEFGENTDGASDARLLVGGEIIEANGRVNGPGNFKFISLTRGLEGTTITAHPPGTLVFDLSGNRSGLDRVRRGFFVDTATGTDLDVLGRNLGLKKCVGLSDAQWREIIREVAYLPKGTIDAFNKALTALVGADNYAISERLISDPYTVFVGLVVALSTSLQGRFMLNGGEPQLTTGALSVDTAYTIVQPPLSDTLTELGAIPSQAIGGRTDEFGAPYFTWPASGAGTLVVGVFDDTPATRRGAREGFTNYAAGGSVAGNTVTLGASPGPLGTPVLVDYGAFSAHYLAENETREQLDDFYAYLADPLLAARCLLSQIRPAGVKVELSVLL